MCGRRLNGHAHIEQAFSNRDVVRHARPADDIRRGKDQKQNQIQGSWKEQSKQPHRCVRNAKPSQRREAELMCGNPIGDVAENAIKRYKTKPGNIPGHTSRPRMRQHRCNQALCPNIQGAHSVCPLRRLVKHVLEKHSQNCGQMRSENIENSVSRRVAATFKAIDVVHATIRKLTKIPTTPGAGVSNGYITT